MLIKRQSNISDAPLASEITPREIFESRRTFVKQLALGSIAGAGLLEMTSREALAQTAGAQ